MDLFIGEEKYLGKGLGQKIVHCFLENYIWPYYQYCIVDPDARNESSIRLFQKCGFIKHKVINTTDALKRRVQLQLFIKRDRMDIRLKEADSEENHHLQEAITDYNIQIIKDLPRAKSQKIILFSIDT